MDTPKWLKEELGTLAVRRLRGDITREEAIVTAAKLVRSKDPEFIDVIVEDWITGRFNYYEERARKDAVERGRVAAATGTKQGTFEDILPSFLPMRLFGPLSTLDDVWLYHEQQCAQTGNFVRIDEEREAWLVARTAAVDGDRRTTLGVAEKAWRHMIGNDGTAAAEG